MAVRTDNNPIDEASLMTALATVLIANTNLQAAGGVIYINDRTEIEMARAVYPTCVLETGTETESKITWRTWKNRLTIKVSYIDRWDDKPTLTLSTIRKNIRADLDLMLSNLRDNGSLIVSSTRHALRVSRITVSGYGSQGDRSAPIQVISCHAQIEFELPPYVTLT